MEEKAILLALSVNLETSWSLPWPPGPGGRVSYPQAVAPDQPHPAPLPHEGGGGGGAPLHLHLYSRPFPPLGSHHLVVDTYPSTFYLLSVVVSS